MLMLGRLLAPLAAIALAAAPAPAQQLDPTGSWRLEGRLMQRGLAGLAEVEVELEVERDGAGALRLERTARVHTDAEVRVLRWRSRPAEWSRSAVTGRGTLEVTYPDDAGGGLAGAVGGAAPAAARPPHVARYTLSADGAGLKEVIFNRRPDGWWLSSRAEGERSGGPRSTTGVLLEVVEDRGLLVVERGGERVGLVTSPAAAGELTGRLGAVVSVGDASLAPWDGPPPPVSARLDTVQRVSGAVRVVDTLEDRFLRLDFGRLKPDGDGLELGRWGADYLARRDIHDVMDAEGRGGLTPYSERFERLAEARLRRRTVASRDFVVRELPRFLERLEAVTSEEQRPTLERLAPLLRSAGRAAQRIENVRSRGDGWRREHWVIWTPHVRLSVSATRRRPAPTSSGNQR